MRRRAERREIMHHPTGGTTIRIDDNAPRSCIYNDRRDGYCAGDREARYPHLFRGNAVFLPSNKRWTGSDLGSVSQLKYLYSLKMGFSARETNMAHVHATRRVVS